MHRFESLCRRIRRNIVVSTTAAGSGHATSSLSAVELMSVLMFGKFFREGTDRLIFSKGHAAPLLYSLYAAMGKIREKELLTLRKFGSRLEGHPMMTFPFTESPTGSLGQGLSIGIGMALATAIDKSASRVFVLLGDGEMAEGSVWEAANFAGVKKVQGLVAILDMNRLGQSAPTALGWNAAAYEKRFRAFGWTTFVVDGHDTRAIVDAYRRTVRSNRPTVVIGKSVKGKGISFLENKPGWHGKALTKAQLKLAMKELA